MAFNGSNLGSQARQKLPVTRRIWTAREERCLIEAFHDIEAQGWKADNGYRHGFLKQLQNKLRISLPGTDLTTVNINSKYGSWKKTYKDVNDTLKNSGFNWNCVTFKVTAGSDATWDEWCAAHHDLAYVRVKSFPYYEQWEALFGRDIANGGGGFDGQVPPIVQPVRLEVDEEVEHVPNGSPAAGGVNNGDAGSPRVSTPPAPTSPMDDSTPPSSSRKRKRSDTTEELAQVITRLWGKATDSMDRIAMRMGREMDEAENRKLLLEAIGSLPMILSSAQKLKACFALCRDEKALDIFHLLTVAEKIDVVNMVLDGLAL